MKIERNDKLKFFLNLAIIILCLFVFSFFKNAFGLASTSINTLVDKSFFDDDLTISYYFNSENSGIVSFYEEEKMTDSFIFNYTLINDQEFEVNINDELVEFYILNDAILDKTNHKLLFLYEEEV